MGTTSIEWTSTVHADGSITPGFSFNPVVGCTKVSPGCDHCYAESWAKRAGSPELWTGSRRRTTAANWRQPLKWNAACEKAGTRARVFCASLADVFDNEWQVEWRADLFALIRATPHLDWLLLTKRIGNVRTQILAAADWHFDHGDRNVCGWLWDWYHHGIAPANVWLGATVVNQEEADRDIPKLLGVPAAERFLSMEPLLGAVDLWAARYQRKPGVHTSAFDWGSGVNWVIVGGESGGRARSLEIGWVSRIVEQCRAANAACFVKQLGAKPLMCGVPWKVSDSKGGVVADWPAPIRIREFP